MYVGPRVKCLSVCLSVCVRLPQNRNVSTDFVTNVFSRRFVRRLHANARD